MHHVHAGTPRGQRMLYSLEGGVSTDMGAKKRSSGRTTLDC